MDEVDVANDYAERYVAAGVAAVVNQAPVAVATGVCLECDEPVEPGRRWCSKDCATDWCKKHGERY